MAQLPTVDEMFSHALDELNKAPNAMSEARDWVKSDTRPLGARRTAAQLRATDKVLDAVDQVKVLIDDAKGGDLAGPGQYAGHCRGGSRRGRGWGDVMLWRRADASPDADERRPKGTAGFYVVAVFATMVSVNTSWRFFGDVFHIGNRLECAAMFAVLEMALVACGVAMRAGVRRGSGPGPARMLAWALCGLSAYMAVDLVGLTEGIARVALGPALALVALHLALGIEVRVRHGERTGTWARIGRELRERALSRLGLANDERDAAERTRDRALRRARDWPPVMVSAYGAKPVWQRPSTCPAPLSQRSCGPSSSSRPRPYGTSTICVSRTCRRPGVPSRPAMAPAADPRNRRAPSLVLPFGAATVRAGRTPARRSAGYGNATRRCPSWTSPSGWAPPIAPCAGT